MIFGKNCVVLCVSNNLILKVYISHQEKYFVNWIIFHHVLNLQIDSASGCWIKKRCSQDCCKNFFGQMIESDARAFQSSLKCRLFDPSWQHSIRESRTYFNMFRPIPIEIENVLKPKQKNSSKCSNLICCRGQFQVQRPFELIPQTVSLTVKPWELAGLHILICFDPYEIENVEQKNSSKCSNLICCRGQIQRRVIVVCRILVLLMTSNEHR